MRVMLKDNKESEIYDVVQVEYDSSQCIWVFLIMNDKGEMATHLASELVILRGDA